MKLKKEKLSTVKNSVMTSTFLVLGDLSPVSGLGCSLTFVLKSRTFFPIFFLLPDVLQTEQQVQTDSMTEEAGVNTDRDWERQLEAMSEYSSSLLEKYNSLTRQLEEDDSTRKKDKEQLQKKKAEAIRQQKVGLTDTHCSR